MDSINTFPDHPYRAKIKFWGVKRSERQYIWCNFSVFLRKNMKPLRKKGRLIETGHVCIVFGWIYLWWMNQTFWLPPLDRMERILKNIQWIRDTFTSENENSSDKTLPTSRFAGKQKKYSRITIVLLHFGHFWFLSTHEILTRILYQLSNFLCSTHCYWREYHSNMHLRIVGSMLFVAM